MLVLTRKRSESIQIGDQIVIKIIQTGRSTVKIGIEAPNEVRVLRSELCDRPAEQLPDSLLGPLAERLRLRSRPLMLACSAPRDNLADQAGS